MTHLISGIHHITAIASDPKKTVDFYTRILGLRLVKKSVNQDDVSTYHLFFGDRTGEPGMDLTFFTFQPAMPGSKGMGQVTLISLAVPIDSLAFWAQRFDQLKVKHDEISNRFGHPRLPFYDHDDQRLELVGVAATDLQPYAQQIWTTPEITRTVAIHYFYSARLTVMSAGLIQPVLTTVLGYQLSDEQLQVYQLPGKERAAYLEVEVAPETEAGITGAGTVHHIAFAVKDEAAQLKVRQNIRELGLYPTEVINRFYFKSVYFRTPAGILFEIATLGPGFTADEAEAELGTKLALPPFLEPHRSQIEAGLTPI